MSHEIFCLTLWYTLAEIKSSGFNRKGVRKMAEKLMNSNEVAKILFVSTERVYALAREGILPACRLGRQLRFSPSKIQAFIDAGGQAFPGGWKRRA